MIKSRGRLLNKEQSIFKKFFDIKSDLSLKDLKNISNFIPANINIVHDKLVDNYIKNGVIKFMLKAKDFVYLDGGGFLTNGKLKVGNLFMNDDNDYIMTIAIQKILNQPMMVLVEKDGKIGSLTIPLFEKLFHGKIDYFKLSKVGYMQFLNESFMEILEKVKDEN